MILVVIPRCTRVIARRIAVVLAVLAFAASARAATSSTAPIHTGIAVDIPAFEQTVERRSDVRFERVVAADIDLDGDIDVVASTNLGFLVWMNDGAGWLVQQAPIGRPRVDGAVPGTAWNDRDPNTDDTIQNDVPSTRLPAVNASTPSIAAAGRTLLRVETTRGDVFAFERPSRAPPRS